MIDGKAVMEAIKQEGEGVFDLSGKQLLQGGYLVDFDADQAHELVIDTRLDWSSLIVCYAMLCEKRLDEVGRRDGWPVFRYLRAEPLPGVGDGNVVGRTRLRLSVVEGYFDRHVANDVAVERGLETFYYLNDATELPVEYDDGIVWMKGKPRCSVDEAE